ETDRNLLAVVPDEARWAVYRLPPRDIVPRVVKSMLATRPKSDEEMITRAWEETEARHTFDAERDLLDNLGDAIGLHNFPPHPLHIPLAMTGLVEIREHPQAVRHCMDGVCQEWRALLERAAQKTGVPSLATVERADDVWYIKIGVIAGPAWTMTDHFIV